MIVVSDTSPLNYLIQIGKIEALHGLFGRVFAPPAVIEELTHTRSRESVRSWALSPPTWLIVRSPTRTPRTTELDRGEREAIALAEELAPQRS